ncbi:MAG TPA: VOC family protein [Kouleothrix sp.]|uniref:VOC family protein n=1 Tax=Kouleothrix sp. TaxID=2779161 RepID=UPI002BCEE0B4|nr:VOC family protein [Kouleothrix sp.]HRC76078.1 VOC family protein [Kouleothrix sp.]
MGRVAHFELSAENMDRAITFYREVFGWNIFKWDGPMEYWLVSTGDPSTPGIDGAIVSREQQPVPVINTINVDSIDDTIAKVTASGGTVMMPKGPVPGVGYLAYCTDSEGNAFGLMQADTSAA